MPAFQKKRRRHPGHQANKNELKVSRRENEEHERTRAGTLHERFPSVAQLRLNVRMETTTGAILEETTRDLDPGEPLLLDRPCLGGCRDGVFPLKTAVENVVLAAKESHEGMGICQASSYRDPKLPCGTKLIYRVDVRYE
jgi:hypothetical protein